MTESKRDTRFLTLKQRIFFLVFNYIPLVHIGLLGGALVSPESLINRLVSGVFVLYLLPPLTARMILLLMPIPMQKIPYGSKEFFVWWIISNLQVLYNRFPFIEEFMRIFPSTYSMWLRLWGARIGRLTYWTAGTAIIDRPFLEIGDDVAFGAGVRLNAHVIIQDQDCVAQLHLAPIKIGNRVFVGGYSLLTTGTEIADDEFTKAFLVSPPFSKWKDGKRVRE